MRNTRFVSLVTAGILSVLSLPAAASCSIEDAVDFLSETHTLHTELELQALQTKLTGRGKTDEQIMAEFAEGFDRLKTKLPQECAAAVEAAVASSGGTRECQLLNGAVERRLNLENYRTVAGFNYGVTGDRPAFVRSLRDIAKIRLMSTPAACWFSATDMTSDDGIVEYPKGQCAQMRAAFEMCKRQAQTALQACTGAPWKRNCAGTAPTCMPPPC